MAQSPVYKRVGQDGQIFYSNMQVKGASEIDLPKITVLPAARRNPVSPAEPRGTALTGQHEAVDERINPVIGQAQGNEATHQNSADQEAPQLSDHDRVQQLIEEMEFYEDSIDALEIELYKLGGGY